VEHDKILTDVVEEYFAGVDPRFIVLTANSVPTAMKMLRKISLDLIVTNHAGDSSFNGLDLLRDIRNLDLVIRTVLIAEKGREEDRNTALSLGCANFLVKPFPDDKLCELVHNMLHSSQGFSGRLIDMRLEDIIQMFCYRKDSTLLSISRDDVWGSIYVHEGGIIHAECDSLTGVEAFYEMLGWEGGEFLSQIVLDIPEQSVFMDWQSLLMEGMRQKDEIRHALAPASASPDITVTPEAGPPRALDVQVSEVEGVKRIMIVDDSRFIRKIVQEILQSDPGVAVAGYATNGQEALAKIEELKPDLILLDWDMPVMKGSTTLMHIMIRSPCPVVILSGFVGGVGANPFDLLCLGGVDFLRKPQNNWRTDGRADDLVYRIKEASRIKFDRIRRVKIPHPIKTTPTVSGGSPSDFLSVFASSIGGCADLIRMIPSISRNLPTAMVVLHDMQQEAIGAFVDYLDRRSKVAVRPLEEGMPLEDGTVYFHPALVPIELVRASGTISVKMLPDFPGVQAMDHFLISAAKALGSNIAAVLLSGGSRRGSAGLRAVKQVDGITLAQDPATSVDPRMAETALKEGIVDFRAPAESIIETFESLFIHETN
jgi:two-component system chemotaxis response regulator CheB